MKKINFILLLMFVITGINFYSCKSSTDKLSQENNKLSFSDSIASSGRKAMPKVKSATEQKSLYNLAKSNLEASIKSKPKSWTIIDAGVWEYEMVYKDGAMSKVGDYVGKWIDMDEKNNYKYGDYNSVEGSGRYHYDNDSHTLLLVDNDESKTPQEFELKLVNEMMIMMGRNTYGNNAIQAKLIKRNNIPSK